MGTTAENVAKLREAYRQWHDTRGGSSQTWLDLMTDDVTMRTVGDRAAGMEFTRVPTGKAGVKTYLDGLAAGWEMIHFTTEHFIADGDRVVVLSAVAFRNRLSGVLVESPKADVFLFRDGLIAEFMEFVDTAGIAASFPPK